MFPFYPEKEQLLYFEEQAKAWRKKAEIFKDYNIMEANFFRDCGLVPADQSENAERGTRAMKRKLSPAMIQKQEQMRQQTVEKGMQIIPRQDLPLVE